MSTPLAPLLVETKQLESLLGNSNLLIIDVSRPQVYRHYHIPGAIHLDYTQIIRFAPPIGGLLPSSEQFNRLMSAIGLTPKTHVVAYDDEGGGNAARLLWTLEAFGHRHFSLLNGGLHSWANEGHPLSNNPVFPEPSTYQALFKGYNVADQKYILKHLNNPNVQILDARSRAEFDGSEAYSKHSGRIPGAIHFKWSIGLDPTKNLRFRSADEIATLLLSSGISSDKEVIVYCQTHHRSALSWFMLKQLGYAKVRGYPGSWSDWGNCDDTPIETNSNTEAD